MIGPVIIVTCHRQQNSLHAFVRDAAGERLLVDLVAHERQPSPPRFATGLVDFTGLVVEGQLYKWDGQPYRPLEIHLATVNENFPHHDPSGHAA